MTLVGRILVVIIMVFACIFLALSIVVYTTAKDWNAETKALNAKIGDARKKVEETKLDLAARDAQLKQSQADMAQQRKNFESRIANLEDENKRNSNEVDEQRKTVETSQQTTKQALDEAEARKRETDSLRETLAQVQEQANKYGLRQTELNDEIRVLKRQLETATTNNKDLRERVGRLQNALRSAGLEDDPAKLASVAAVPQYVEGQIKRVNARNNKVEITIGSDDGLAIGNTLEVYRTKPTPEYLGKIRLDSVDPDQAVGSVVGKTVHGKKIQEGDIVSPTIRSR